MALVHTRILWCPFLSRASCDLTGVLCSSFSWQGSGGLIRILCCLITNQAGGNFTRVPCSLFSRQASGVRSVIGIVCIVSRIFCRLIRHFSSVSGSCSSGCGYGEVCAPWLTSDACWAVSHCGTSWKFKTCQRWKQCRWVSIVESVVVTGCIVCAQLLKSENISRRQGGHMQLICVFHYLTNCFVFSNGILDDGFITKPIL